MVTPTLSLRPTAIRQSSVASASNTQRHRNAGSMIGRTLVEGAPFISRMFEAAEYT